MRAPQTGLTLPLKDALTQLTDNKGNLIEFEEQEDGSYKSKDFEGDADSKGNVRYRYSYDLMPAPVMVTVYANKIKNEDNTKKKQASTTTTKEEEKAIEDAKTVAEQAPDAKTKKEAEKVASFGKK